MIHYLRNVGSTLSSVVDTALGYTNPPIKARHGIKKGYWIGWIALQHDKEGDLYIGIPDEFWKLFALCFFISAVTLYKANRDS